MGIKRMNGFFDEAEDRKKKRQNSYRIINDNEMLFEQGDTLGVKSVCDINLIKKFKPELLLKWKERFKRLKQK